GIRGTHVVDQLQLIPCGARLVPDGDEARFVARVGTVGRDVLVVTGRLRSRRVVKGVALAVPVEFVIHLEGTADAVLVKQVKVHPEFAGLRLSECSPRVLLKEYGPIGSFLHEYATKLLDDMSVAGEVRKQAVGAVGRFIRCEYVVIHGPHIA